MSDTFMQSIDLRNGVYEQQAVELLADWEKNADSIVLGDAKRLLIEGHPEGVARDTRASADATPQHRHRHAGARLVRPVQQVSQRQPTNSKGTIMAIKPLPRLILIAAAVAGALVRDQPLRAAPARVRREQRAEPGRRARRRLDAGRRRPARARHVDARARHRRLHGAHAGAAVERGRRPRLRQRRRQHHRRQPDGAPRRAPRARTPGRLRADGGRAGAVRAGGRQRRRAPGQGRRVRRHHGRRTARLCRVRQGRARQARPAGRGRRRARLLARRGQVHAAGRRRRPTRRRRAAR